MRTLSGIAALLLAIAHSLPAQAGPPEKAGRWSLGFVVGSAGFSGGSRGTEPESDTLRFVPTGTTLGGLTLNYGAGGFRVGIAARYGQPGIGLQGPAASGLLIVAEDAYGLILLSLGVSAHLLTLRGGPTLRSSLGLDVERWSAAGSPARSIAGGQAGVTMEVMLTRAFVATLDAELGWSPRSPFRKEDVPDGFRLRPTWRRALSGGIAWRI